MGILNKLKHFLPKQAKLHIYNSPILSHLNFGILAWGYKCDRIYKLQKYFSVLFASANIMHILSLYLNLSTY